MLKDDFCMEWTKLTLCGNMKINKLPAPDTEICTKYSKQLQIAVDLCDCFLCLFINCRALSLSLFLTATLVCLHFCFLFSSVLLNCIYFAYVNAFIAIHVMRELFCLISSIKLWLTTLTPLKYRANELQAWAYDSNVSI